MVIVVVISCVVLALDAPYAQYARDNPDFFGKTGGPLDVRSRDMIQLTAPHAHTPPHTSGRIHCTRLAPPTPLQAAAPRHHTHTPPLPSHTPLTCPSPPLSLVYRWSSTSSSASSRSSAPSS